MNKKPTLRKRIALELFRQMRNNNNTLKFADGSYIAADSPRGIVSNGLFLFRKRIDPFLQMV
ncbi:MAG: hypothetical protein LBL58_15620 [Tannerellaceae bacterium]|jgi:hypothetical protein|nr:hypothetical protein [Tannerellaceae bacterium]